jgi:hypothetical protein
MSDKHRYNNFEAELKQIRQYLSKYNATATMVAVALDIYRPNLCRHKITLQIKGLLVVTHRAECKVTGYQADYLSCNPDIVKGVLNG